jgi:pimeloyl-ACP methyl ester carboxylesterase
MVGTGATSAWNDEESVKRRAIIAADPFAASGNDGRARVFLNDGRRVGYALYGDAAARRGVVYLHGFPGSCLEPVLVADRLQGTGLALLALDRPGYGASDACPGDRAAPETTGRLASALVAHHRWDRYALLAVSGSGPAAVAALADPDPRLTGCLFLSVFPPSFATAPRADGGLVRAHAVLARWAPPLFALEARLVARRFGVRPSRLRDRLRRMLPPPDRDALGDPRLARTLEASWARGLRGGGGRGLAVDFAHFLRPLVPPPAPPFPCLSVHGGRDRVVPPELQDYLLKALPYVSRSRWPEAGHFSWIDTRLEEILAVLRRWLAVPA